MKTFVIHLKNINNEIQFANLSDEMLNEADEIIYDKQVNDSKYHRLLWALALKMRTEKIKYL